MVLDAHSAPNITGPAAIDGIGPTDDWQGYWQKTDLSKRKAASWANGGWKKRSGGVASSGKERGCPARCRDAPNDP